MALAELINLQRYSSSCPGLAFFEVSLGLWSHVELETIVLCKTHHTQMTNSMYSHSFVMEKEAEVTEVNRQTVVTRDWGEQGKARL